MGVLRNMKTSLSVVVPVFNAEQYLEQCVESIINQTYKDMEIILVDDGSTDRTGAICDRYASDYDFIRVIHQENRGNVATRCRGLKEAVGEYVTFLDSDDWIDLDMYEILMETVKKEQCDIVSMGGYVSVKGDKQRIIEDATIYGTFRKGKNLHELLSRMMFDFEKGTRGIHPSLCCKVLRRKVVLQAVANINSQVVMGGDAAIFYPCCVKAESICIIKEYKYFYRQVEQSVSSTHDITRFNKIYVLYQYLEQEFQKYDEEYHLIEQLRRYMWYFLSFQIEQVFGLEIKKTWLFPYKMIDKNSKIVLYGAGKVGESYREQILKSGYCDIVAWADSNAYLKNESIISPMQIEEFDYSKVVIAVKSKRVAAEIIGSLKELGIDEEKIVWQEVAEMSLID